MPKKLSRKLAGCFAIELLFAAGLLAADSDYQAGTAAAGKVKALALEDRRGHRAVFATAEFPLSQSVSDFIAVQVLKAYGVDRAGLLLYSAGQGDPAPDDAVTAIGAALGSLEPAVVRSSGGAVSITAPDGRCRAMLAANGAVAFETLILRGGNNNSWLHWNFEERRRGDYLRDEWKRLVEVCKHLHTWIIGAYSFAIWTPIAVFAAGLPRS